MIYRKVFIEDFGASVEQIEYMIAEMRRNQASWRRQQELHRLGAYPQPEDDCDCNGANRDGCPVCRDTGETGIPY